ncbi:hypothetical protein LBMAG53_37560 [Planctomycetota bacterium]|nr:hypothetical protein LBMAG53_37560 [Planctomycetota bacterium]
MLRPLLAATVLACALGAGAAADPSAPVVPVVAAEMAKNGNVRFGPDTKAKPVATLKAGSAVEVIGPAAGAPDWVVIRFPRQGKAWVHVKNLQALQGTAEGTALWRVVGRGANVRDDATMGAALVAQLAVGEILEDQGQRVGDWIAVYPANAVAYTHKDNLRLPATVNLPKLAEEQRLQRDVADRLWAVVQSTYEDFRKAAQARPETALSKDWAGLKAQLEQVTAKHPDVQVRVAADAIKVRVTELVTAAEQYVKIKGTPVGPIQPVPQPGEAPVAPTPAVAQAQQQATTAAAQLPAAAPVSAFAAEGLIVQQEFSKLQVTYVVMSQDGQVKALLKSRAPEVQLSEYIYRYAGVKGGSEPLTTEQTGLSATVPLIAVDEVVLLNR